MDNASDTLTQNYLILFGGCSVKFVKQQQPPHFNLMLCKPEQSSVLSSCFLHGHGPGDPREGQAGMLCQQSLWTVRDSSPSSVPGSCPLTALPAV